jgi:hypothetical protein
MRRFLHIRGQRSALVAIYDALLFLMVAILIAEGMFLYAATSVSDGGDFSDDMYQRLCDNQRTMVEGLSTNFTLPSPLIMWSNGTHNRTEPLINFTEPTEAETVAWLLESYSQLTFRNDAGQAQWDGHWNTSPILPLVDDFFRGNQLNGTEHAWMFLYGGEIKLFGSSSIESVEDLPEERWASSGNYTLDTQSYNYEAELRYYLWYP